jgi:hypothetical protein
VLERQLLLRASYVARAPIYHQNLFVLEDGNPISDPEVTRWRSNESLQVLGIRGPDPYHARHSSVSWQLIRGKNLLWVAKQHGHSVEVMLRMYAAWIEGATPEDISAIERAMTHYPASPQIVVSPPRPPAIASRMAVGGRGSNQVLEDKAKEVAERVGLLAAGDGRSSSASLRTG